MVALPAPAEGSGVTGALDVEDDPGGVMVGAVAAEAGASVDVRGGLGGLQVGREPEVVEQLVVGGLARRLESVRPGRRGGRGVAGVRGSGPSLRRRC